MEKHCNVIAVTIDKLGAISKRKSDNHLTIGSTTHLNESWVNQHLHIISNEDIEKFDWYYVPNQMMGFEHISNEFTDAEILKSIGARKIIATTDILTTVHRFNGNNDIVAKIPESFIEEYVRAKGNINKVSVQYEETIYNHIDKVHCISPKIRSNNTVIISAIKTYSKKEIVELVQSKIDEFVGDAEGDFEYNGLFNFQMWIEDNL